MHYTQSPAKIERPRNCPVVRCSLSTHIYTAGKLLLFRFCTKIGYHQSYIMYQPLHILYHHDTVDNIIHEIFHTLGRYHEHSREDRDEYVIVHPENILKGSQLEAISPLAHLMNTDTMQTLPYFLFSHHSLQVSTTNLKNVQTHLPNNFHMSINH